MNLEIWNGLSADQQKLLLDVSRETQTKIREATESVDNFAKAKSELEPFGMIVVEAKVEEFRKVAQAEDLAGLQEPVRRDVGRDRRLQGPELAAGPRSPLFRQRKSSGHLGSRFRRDEPTRSSASAPHAAQSLRHPESSSSRR